MFCKKCGNEQKPGEKFCSRCGNPFNEEDRRTIEKSLKETAFKVADATAKMAEQAKENAIKAGEVIKEKTAAASVAVSETATKVGGQIKDTASAVAEGIRDTTADTSLLNSGKNESFGNNDNQSSNDEAANNENVRNIDAASHQRCDEKTQQAPLDEAMPLNEKNNTFSNVSNQNNNLFRNKISTLLLIVLLLFVKGCFKYSTRKAGYSFYPSLSSLSAPENCPQWVQGIWSGDAGNNKVMTVTIYLHGNNNGLALFWIHDVTYGNLLSNSNLVDAFSENFYYDKGKLIIGDAEGKIDFDNQTIKFDKFNITLTRDRDVPKQQ